MSLKVMGFESVVGQHPLADQTFAAQVANVSGKANVHFFSVFVQFASGDETFGTEVTFVLELLGVLLHNVSLEIDEEDQFSTI